ncbi:MAG: acetyl-CoA carboxylase biotin carboxyl carrier protein [Parachlamydiales bacterium]
MDLEQIEALMEAMGRHEIAQLKIREGEREIKLEHMRGRAAPAPMAHVAPSAPAASPIEVPAGQPASTGKWIPSPMVGTFYRSSSPDSAPFVKEGDTVTADTVVCIVEAMKVMNEVKAGVAGKIAEVRPKNGDPVEFGSELFRIT